MILFVVLRPTSSHPSSSHTNPPINVQGEDVVSTPDLESALRDAAKEGDVDTVQTMIDNGVVDLNAGAPEVSAYGLTSFNPSHKGV